MSASGRAVASVDSVTLLLGAACLPAYGWPAQHQPSSKFPPALRRCTLRKLPPSLIHVLRRLQVLAVGHTGAPSLQGTPWDTLEPGTPKTSLWLQTTAPDHRVARRALLCSVCAPHASIIRWSAIIRGSAHASTRCPHHAPHSNQLPHEAHSTGHNMVWLICR